jgi:hypothetical protein
MRKERRNEDHKHTTKANHIGSLSPAGETLPACRRHVRRTARRGDVLDLAMMFERLAEQFAPAEARLHSLSA